MKILTWDKLKINLGKTYAKLRIFPQIFFVNRAPGLHDYFLTIEATCVHVGSRLDVKNAIRASVTNTLPSQFRCPRISTLLRQKLIDHLVNRLRQRALRGLFHRDPDAITYTFRWRLPIFFLFICSPGIFAGHT